MANLVASNTDAYSQVVANVRTVAQSASMHALNNGNDLLIDYTNVRQSTPVPSGIPFCRVVMQVVGERSRTLSVPSRVTKRGVIDIQLCVPKPLKDGALVGNRMADLLQRALIGQTDGVVFYQSFIKPVAPDEAFYMWRVSSTFNYDISEG